MPALVDLDAFKHLTGAHGYDPSNDLFEPHELARVWAYRHESDHRVGKPDHQHVAQAFNGR